MIPILFDSDEEEFTSNGIGRLSDVISCVVLEERNGRYELEMDYPSNGVLYHEILTGRYIYCSVGRMRRQPFEIYASSKPMNGRVTFYARHISYRLSLIPVKPFSSAGLPSVWTGLTNNAMEDLPFTFYSNFTDFSKSFEQKLPGSVRSFLGGGEGSILDLYGGEFEWDMWSVYLRKNRGSDKGVSIRYGKNMTDLRQEESIEDTYTGVVPYYNAKDTVVYGDVQLSELAENYPYNRVVVVDVTDRFDDIPTKAQVNAAGEDYIAEQGFGIPTVNLNVSFINLADTEEYKNIAALETVSLCDTVTVYFERLGVSAKSKVITTRWDSLKERYNSIELGAPKASMSARVAQKEAKKEPPPTYSELQDAIEHATDLLTGEMGGYVVLHQNNEGKPYEILIMDNEDINRAVNIWKFNQAGWGHSSHGYAGPYTLAATMENGIVADFIKTGELDANLIKAGVIQDKEALNSLNMITGAFSLANGNFIYTPGSDYISLLNNLSLRLNGVPLAGRQGDSSKVTASLQCASKISSLSAQIWERPYDIIVCFTFWVSQDFTDADNNYMVIEIDYRPNHDFMGVTDTLVVERKDSNDEPTGNIRTLFNFWAYKSNPQREVFALTTEKPSQFRAGYYYRGMATLITDVG